MKTSIGGRSITTTREWCARADDSEVAKPTWPLQTLRAAGALVEGALRARGDRSRGGQRLRKTRNAQNVRVMRVQHATDRFETQNGCNGDITEKIDEVC